MKKQIRINNQILSDKLRVIDENGENLGVIAKDAAIQKAMSKGLDLIEVSGSATPPIARITDYGKYRYEQKKKDKDAKAKSHITETKTMQVKIGTGEHDLTLKAKNASKWLSDGHRIKFDLFLAGRAKYMDQGFLKKRMERLLVLISENFKIADGPKKSPKGLTIILERSEKPTDLSALKNEKMLHK